MLRSRKEGDRENAENQGEEVGNIVVEDPDFVQWRDIVGNLESCFALTRTLPSGSSATKDRISFMREIGDCREKGFNERESKNMKLFSKKTLAKNPSSPWSWFPDIPAQSFATFKPREIKFYIDDNILLLDQKSLCERRNKKSDCFLHSSFNVFEIVIHLLKFCSKFLSCSVYTYVHIVSRIILLYYFYTHVIILLYYYFRRVLLKREHFERFTAWNAGKINFS